MKLTVKNFGPIREARNIDISPMTIFVGPSNTGKSYLAMLIYSIFKVITDEEFTWELAHGIRRKKKYLPESSDKPGKSGNPTLGEIEASFIEWTQSISDAWRYQFDYCFGEEGRKMIARKDGNNGLSVTISDNENQLSLNLTSPGQSSLRSRKKQKIYEYVTLRFLDYIEESSGEEKQGAMMKKRSTHSGLSDPILTPFLNNSSMPCCHGSLSKHQLMRITCPPSVVELYKPMAPSSVH